MWYRTEFDFIVLLIHLHTRKIPFNAPVFNNVTSHALFYGGHLVMRSKRCAVQNKGITLNDQRMKKEKQDILCSAKMQVKTLPL